MAKLTLKGLHQVRWTNRDGSETWHIYAWRGGPKIATSPHKVHVADDALISAYQNAYARPPAGNISATRRTLRELISEWRSSAEFRGLKPGSRKDYDDQVKKIEAGEWRNEATGKSVRIADLTFKDLEDRRVRGVILAWRDENFAGTPRTADKVVGTLSACLSWGVDRGKIATNHLLGVAKLHKVNRSDVIWTDADLEKVKPHCSTDLWRAVQLAALTGLAITDLVHLPWSAYDGEAIEGRRVKTGREFLIPALPELRTLLADTPRRSTIILTNAYGKPWSPSGLSHRFGEARDAADAASLEAAQETGGEVNLLAGRLVFHDLRGTAATRLIANGLSYAQAGAILGWDEKRVEAIARRYINRKTVISAMMGRLALANATDK